MCRETKCIAETFLLVNISSQFDAKCSTGVLILVFFCSSEERITVLVIGGGGREHALCYALTHSPSCETVLCAPGNAGIAQSRDAVCISDLDISSSDAVISFCCKRGVGMVVVGPEGPLVAGLANDLVKAGIQTFGPSSEAAALEGSKDFMKRLCDKCNIPTAQVIQFTFVLSTTSSRVHGGLFSRDACI